MCYGKTGVRAIKSPVGDEQTPSPGFTLPNMKDFIPWTGDSTADFSVTYD